MEPHAAPDAPRWEWRASYEQTDSWIPYAEHDSLAIEQAFQSGFSPAPIGRLHHVDFNASVQRRLGMPIHVPVTRARLNYDETVVHHEADTRWTKAPRGASSERERPIRRVPDAPFPAVVVAEVRRRHLAPTLRPGCLRLSVASHPRAPKHALTHCRAAAATKTTGVGERDEKALW